MQFRFKSLCICPSGGNHHIVHELSISNNGKVFTDDDWVRLSTIASGNPDPDKVGMFGVGFYSVFSLTDEPTIKSGNQAMRFRWDGQALTFSRNSQMLSHFPGSETIMALKSDRSFEYGTVVWEAFLKDLKAFLLRLVMFLRNVKDLYIQVDGSLIFHVSKELNLRPPLRVTKEDAVSIGGLFAASMQASYGDLVITARSVTPANSATNVSVDREQQTQCSAFQLLRVNLKVQVCKT